MAPTCRRLFSLSCLMSFFVVLLLPSLLPCHLWYLHCAGGFWFQLRLSLCVVDCKLVAFNTTERFHYYVFFSLAVGKSLFCCPPPQQGQRLGSATKHYPCVRDSDYPLTQFSTLLTQKKACPDCFHFYLLIKGCLYEHANDSVNFTISTSGKHLSNMAIVPSFSCFVTCLGTSLKFLK